MFEYLSTGPVIDLTTATASNFSLSSLSNNRLLTMWSTFVDTVGTTFWARITDVNGQPLSAAIKITGPTLYGTPTPVVTELSDGRFVVAWQQSDFSTAAIHAQIYSSTGTPLGAEITVPGPVGGRQYFPDIAATSDGGFVVGWNTNSINPGGDILVQRFSAAGTATGSYVQVNTAVSGGQTISDIAGLPNGSFVVTWSVSSDVHARVVDASGALVGSEFTVNTATTGGQGSAQVEVLSGGRYVIVWESSDAARDGSGSSVLAQVFEANGTPVGSEILVNTVTAGNQGNPSVAALADGTFVVSWANETVSNTAANYVASSIRAQVFDASGLRQGSEIVVQSNNTANEVNPTVVALANGGFSVGWIEYAGVGVGLITRSELRTFAPVGVQQIAAGASALTLDENRTIVGTLALTDGNGQPLTYAITGGADAARFTIDNTTGALSFVAAPNFEAPGDVGANNVYDVVITASGAQGSSNQAIAVSVANINEAPVISSNGGGSTASVTRSENGTTVTTVLTSDPDGNAITYSIVGGADAARFAINSSTGALSFVSAPNYEAPTDVGSNNVYDVIVQASDGTLADTQAIAVTVTNVNEPLVLTNNGGGATAAISLQENNLGVTTLTASDPENGTITYYIVGGTDAARFTINAQTGALQFASNPNFEAPADADANNVYLVTVGATDGLNWDYQDLTVTVTNVNEAPVITSGGGGDTASGTFNENSTVAAYVVTSTDPEGTARIYSIIGGADAARFTINSSTGQLRFAATPNFEAPVDADGNNVYEVIVRASDGTLSDTQALTITVLNVNEAPVLSSNGGGSSANITLAENTANVTTVAATDPDGTAITYAIAGGLDAALFTIDPQTGLLRFVSAPNFENPADNGANNVYNVNVRAIDATGVVTTQALAITVTNVNEAPVFNSPASFSTSENALAVGTVVASDPEGAARTYSIVGGADAALFTIDAATGALSFVAAPNYEAPADANSDNAYQVTVLASDGSLSATQAVTVTVGNVNEAPVITSDGAGASAALGIAENSTAVTTVTSSDPDGNPRTYSISGGADAALFTIDAATGVLSFVSAPNYEAPTDSDGNNVYQVTVSASDGSLVDTQTLAVTVSNVNEAPAIVSTANISASENSVAAGIVAASDPDGTALTYSIVGGADGALFTIDAVTGALSFVNAPNFEAPGDADGDNSYQVTVQASDGSLSATQAVTVTVGDTNEGPSITSGSSFSAPENGTAVATLAASDPDGNTLTWSISGGADAALFTIDAATGALSFVSAPNYEAPSDANGDNLYDVIVSASDGSLSASQTLSVAVTNVNEAPAISSQASLSIAENTVAAGSVLASDPDGTALTYTIVGGADAALFAINAATGALSFVSAPNYETPVDANGDNAYEVTVRASDGSLSATQAVTVMVTNVNEGPAITSSSSFTVAENGSTVATLVGSDPEGTALIWSISGGADAALFTIDAATGALSFVSAPNYEAPTDAGANNVYDVVVTASDGLLATTQAIAVAVSNANEGQIVASGQGATINENTTAAGSFSASDIDGDALSYAISGGADAALFTINAQTGAVSFISAPNYEAPGDSDHNNVYNLVITASDGSISTSGSYTVTVGNVNEAPVITGSTVLAASENGTAVATLSSTDPEGNPRTWSISGGADAVRFVIDAQTGALSFVTAPDYEAPSDSNGDNQYLVQVTVSDGSLSSSQLFTVNLGNVNEAPIITSNGGGASASLTLSENTATVTTVTSTDPEGTARTYSIIGGADAARFTINASTGALTFITAPNYESPTDSNLDNIYNVIVAASDGLLTDTQALAITVTNVNEAPVITSNGGGDTAAITVNENTTAVTTLTSTDPEGTARTYSIVGGADAARFTINSATGALSFVSAPNWEAPTDSNGDNVYNVIVAASDGTLTDTQTLAVTVGNVVDGSTINGTNSANTLTGTTAEDTINGLGGNDTITGGLGADVLTGGTGADTFVYSSINDSSLSAPDRITDFTLSQNDRISLSAIDANTGLAGDQAFTWIGTGNFSNVAGQLRYYQSGGHTYVTGDVNGDGVGDFLIQLDPAVTLSASYFVL